MLLCIERLRAVLWAWLLYRRGRFRDDEVLEQHVQGLRLNRSRVNDKEVIAEETLLASPIRSASSTHSRHWRAPRHERQGRRVVW